MNANQPQKIFANPKTKIIIAAILAFAAGYIAKSVLSPQQPHSPHTEAEHKQAQQIWTCSMHPQIRQNKPGKCPICFMDLIPVTSGENTKPTQISFSENSLKLMEIQTTPAERKFVDAPIRLVGMIDYDESRIKNITAWTDGRIDRLFVDFTGIRVVKGDHMVSLYSPQLISAQAEFLESLRATQNLSAQASDMIKKSIQDTTQASKEKLLLLGISEEQIEQIAKTGQPSNHITINSPVDGIVIEKQLSEGEYVQTGTIIYTIADLSHLWIKLDAYESDLQWIRYGQQVEFTAEALPGQTFRGIITFIPPVLDPVTRTVKVRVNFDNPDGKLKPGMFVRAVVNSKIASDAIVIDQSLAGKFICPMHTWVIKDSNGQCDICSMDLVVSEKLGYIVQTPDKPPLVIPASAPMITGKRAVVYVQVPDANKPTFEGREIAIGPRAGDYYIVEAGLAEGELVVTNGNFKIDSALQIQAKPSMMSPGDSNSALPPAHHGSSHMQETIEQTLCPVMGGPIDKKYYTIYKGQKVYFCCPGCDAQFNKEPEKYLPKLPQFQK